MLNKNIFFLLGCPCSGKTTVGKILADKYGMHCFSGDEQRFHYYGLADASVHKYMTMDTSDFWSWSLDEMIAWERGVIAEQTPMVLKDLTDLSKQHKYVLFEGMLDMNYLKEIVPASQAAYLTVDRKICEQVFFERFDHSAMVDAIMREEGVSDSEKAVRIRMRREAAVNAFFENADKYGFKTFSRNNMKEPAEMVKCVEKHFGLCEI